MAHSTVPLLQGTATGHTTSASLYPYPYALHFIVKQTKTHPDTQTLLGVTFCKSFAPAKLENCKTDGRNFIKVSQLSSQVNNFTGCDCLCDFFGPLVPQIRNLFPAQGFNSFLYSFTLLPAAPLLPPPLSQAPMPTPAGEQDTPSPLPASWKAG